MKAPLMPVSWGELIDKITILEIKGTELSAPEALVNVKRELECLLSQCELIILSNSELHLLKAELIAVNRKLWQIEDDNRDKEQHQEFDRVFIELDASINLISDVVRTRLRGASDF